MAREQTVTVEGMDQLAKVLKLLPTRIKDGVRAAVADETREVADDMRRLAPRDTGTLADSIQAEISQDGLSGTAAATARYATFVEHGTEDTPEQPFAEPAAALSRRRFRRRLVDSVDASLRKIVK